MSPHQHQLKRETSTLPTSKCSWEWKQIKHSDCIRSNISIVRFHKILLIVFKARPTCIFSNFYLKSHINFSHWYPRQFYLKGFLLLQGRPGEGDLNSCLWQLHSEFLLRDSCQTKWKGAERNNIHLDLLPDSHLVVLISFHFWAHLPVLIFMADLWYRFD